MTNAADVFVILAVGHPYPGHCAKWDIRGFHCPLVLPGRTDLLGEAVLLCAFRSEHDATLAEMALEGQRGVSVCSPPGVEFDLYPEALEIRVAVEPSHFEIRPALRVGEQNPISGALVLPAYGT
jgi:hypothetical protein